MKGRTHLGERASRSSHASQRHCDKDSVRSKASSYKDKARNYYTSFGGKVPAQPEVDYAQPMTPTGRKDNMLKKMTNCYIKNRNLEEKEILAKSIKYLDKKGILTNKINKKYFKDNDIADYLKVNKKQCLCHQMRIGDQQLRVRYPKAVNSLYNQDFEKNRGKVGGKTEVFNRDKEKKFFTSQPLTMQTTKQMDFTGEQVPYQKVKKSRPATSYGPFISSTSYGHTFQGWDASGSYVPTLKPNGNLISSTGMPFRASSAYRDTYKTAAGGRPATGVAGGANGGAMGANGTAKSSRLGSAHARNANADPNAVFGGKNRNQKSQISILSSPGKNVPFMKETTNRSEFRGQRNMERSRPIRHPDNLGNVDLKVDPKVFNTNYRNNFVNFGEGGNCKREEERVTIRKELKQLQ